MIRKLRLKFVLTNLLSVLLVLLLVFGTLCVFNYHRLTNELERTLRELADRPMGFPVEKPMIGEKGPKPWSAQVLAFSVLLDEEGGAELVEEENVSVTEEVKEAAVREALASSAQEGTLPGLSLAFLVSQTPQGTKIAFADLGHVGTGMQSLVFTSLAVGAAVLSIFFLISLFLSKRALKPVEQAWEQQRRFVADASHELKTPLTVILANLGVLLSHPSDPISKQQVWLENSLEEAERMRRLVEDLVFLARGDAATIPLVSSHVNLSDLVLATLLSFEPVAFEQGVDLDSEVDADVCMEGDEGQLRQLLGILLDNGIKYAGRGGCVSVSLLSGKPSGCSPIFTVKNTGEPISEHDLPHIFDRFYRVDEARTRERGGFGLGLAIAKQIAEHHGARIAVESGEDGTAFRVRF